MSTSAVVLLDVSPKQSGSSSEIESYMKRRVLHVANEVYAKYLSIIQDKQIHVVAPEQKVIFLWVVTQDARAPEIVRYTENRWHNYEVQREKLLESAISDEEIAELLGEPSPAQPSQPVEESSGRKMWESQMASRRWERSQRVRESSGRKMNFLQKAFARLAGAAFCPHCGNSLGRHVYATTCPSCHRSLKDMA